MPKAEFLEKKKVKTDSGNKNWENILFSLYYQKSDNKVFIQKAQFLRSL